MPSRARQLEQAFDTIARTRMAGLPTVHPALQVEAVGFAPQPGPAGEAGLLGALVTPWCLNLVWLPEKPLDTFAPIRVGVAREHALGGERYAFLGAHEALCGLGVFEACSLFSPMQDFADHAGARAVAVEVLRMLRAQPERDEVPAPARRQFLLQRRTA
jgi:[NiFe] hydrogenase assembly HybE family chaperone